MPYLNTAAETEIEAHYLAKLADEVCAWAESKGWEPDPGRTRWAAELRIAGYKVINPAEYGNLVTGWQECMKRDIHALLWCDAVVVLPGWRQSRDANVEVSLARELEMPVIELADCRQGGCLL